MDRIKLLSIGQDKRPRGPIYTLKVKAIPKEDGCILVKIRTQLMPKSKLPHKVKELHPFYRLPDDDLKDDPKLQRGFYEEWVADNVATRAILEIIPDEKKLEAGSGHTAWDDYRAILIKCLHLLWD